MHIFREGKWSPAYLTIINPRLSFQGFPGGSVVKNLPANVGDSGSIHGLGRSPRAGNGNPLQDSCLGNTTDRGDWQATVYGVTKESDNLGTQQQQLVSFNQTAHCQPRDSFSGLCSTDQESNLSSVCPCITCELRLFFLHLQLVTKNSSKEYCWDTWKLDAIQISVSVNNIPLEHSHSCLFVYLLSTACSTMTELSSGDRWGLQSWQDFLGGLHWESLPTSCLRDDTFKVCILPACQLGFSPILSISESCNFFWEAFLTLAPHSLGSFNSPTPLLILCFSLLTLATVNNGGIRGGSNPASFGDPKLCESRSMSVLVTTISVVFSMCVDIQFLQACLTLCHTMAVALRAPPWDTPGKNTGVGCCSLLQGIFLTQESNSHPLHYRQILYCWAIVED